METTRLSTVDHAKALVDCVYDTYGLTFHRSWLYDPQEIMDLNARGDVLSFLAMDGTSVVGHLGLIRPAFEITDDGAPVTSGASRETGLSMVRPVARRSGVQAALALSAMQHLLTSDISGTFMKCVTRHTGSQKGARRNGAVPTGLLLGSIPRWIEYGEDGNGREEPISCVQYHLALRPQEKAAYVPKGFEWLPDLWGASCTPRVEALPRPAEGETRLIVKWQGDRQLAQIYVLEAGADLVERLEERIAWLLRGHIAHVLVFLPGDSPAVGAAGRDMEAVGLFPAGWIPGYFKGRRDALLYQVNTFPQMSLDRVHVVGDDAQLVARRVHEGWQRTRAATLRHVSPDGAPGQVLDLDAARRARELAG